VSGGVNDVGGDWGASRLWMELLREKRRILNRGDMICEEKGRKRKRKRNGDRKMKEIGLELAR
jgi:hypothetical protein